MIADVYDAIERLSAELSQRIGTICEARGFAHKAFQGICASPNKAVIVVNTTVLFPGGHYASFTPAGEPTGNVWPIDVRRTDGVKRPAWASGLVVVKSHGGWVLSRGAGPLDDEQLSILLYALAQP